ncbi:hypothetical protein C5B96_14015 [Subtercola sp. Z020]|nr:hypothetical protein C5B96_14015 [Subtercola sp. Z020]
MIVGRVGRRLNNALIMAFDGGGGGVPFATARQGAGNGFGMTLKMLFGLANHGPGKQVITLADGSKIVCDCHMRGFSTFSRDGVVIGQVEGTSLNPKKWGFDHSTVTDGDGRTLYAVEADPDRPNTMSLHSMLLLGADREVRGWLDVVLSRDGWGIDVGALGLPGVLGDLASLTSISSAGTGDLPIVNKGTRLVLARPPSPAERDVLLAMCVDLAICGRTYTRWDQSVTT